MPHFMLRFKESYENEITGFVNAVVNDTTPVATEDDAVAAFKISQASIKSAGEKIKVDVE